MNTIYTSGEYLEKTKTWHEEDSSWKAEQALRMLRKHNLTLRKIGEIGCGAGGVIDHLAQDQQLAGAVFHGYDISPQAIDLAKTKESPRIQFTNADLLNPDDAEQFDLLLAFDVFEHAPDYLGFLQKCAQKARWKLFHIPLDLHVSSLLRNAFMQDRYTVGHLHYFTADSALAALRDSGHRIVDISYTNAAADLFFAHPSFKRAVANVPRWLVSLVDTGLSARLFGGYSLMVLTE